MQFMESRLMSIKWRILIVDDDTALRTALSIRLRGAGFDVLDSANPEAAAELAVCQRPDLILLDINMPRYTGLEFHECLKFTKRGREIPVVYLSGERDEIHRQTAMKQGARAFVTKPYQPEALIRTICDVLHISQAQAVQPRSLSA
jgi:DNA-binding response OmpR family regulator